MQIVTICKKCQILFSGENKNVINFLSASFAHRVVKVKQTRYTWKISAFFFHKTDNFCDFLFAFLLCEIALDLTAWCPDRPGPVMFKFTIKNFVCMSKQ